MSSAKQRVILGVIRTVIRGLPAKALVLPCFSRLLYYVRFTVVYPSVYLG